MFWFRSTCLPTAASRRCGRASRAANGRQSAAKPVSRSFAACSATPCSPSRKNADGAVTTRFAGPPSGAVTALPRCADRDDQKFLELARDSGADWLVTADKALLKLARRDRLRGLFRILTPETALAEI
jgi:hypothetical protein